MPSVSARGTPTAVPTTATAAMAITIFAHGAFATAPVPALEGKKIDV